MWAGLGSRSPLLVVMSHIVVQELVGEEGRGRRGGRAERSGPLNTKRYTYLLGSLWVFVSEGAAGKGGTGELEVELLWGQRSNCRWLGWCWRQACSKGFVYLAESVRSHGGRHG